eukprot:TRINITY_DN4016_c0_g1_i4.p2 TRINITY_DN4016_c0_g1~~TRINITY_DN4016_c0_g1_i4.p2  ORF type:complete len:1043 (-),score=180.42 TRINITY_DN4016_c0_g1_i4:3765-6755(-)
MHSARGPHTSGPPHYICTFSSRVIVYKGQLMPTQLPTFYLDLVDPTFTSKFGMVHSRFSTNTFPSWMRAQPNRLSCHNGEINTLRGNLNRVQAREGTMATPLLLPRGMPRPSIIEPDLSDSAMMDNVLELQAMAGRPIHEVMSMMMPRAYECDPEVDEATRAYYTHHATLMEPWDGPAMIAFTDPSGTYIGAALDRNGLRPCRYYLTKDDRVIVSSEVGILSSKQLDPSDVVKKGRLVPGGMLLMDMKRGRIVPHEEIARELANRHPYAKWIKDEMITWDHLDVNEDEDSSYVAPFTGSSSSSREPAHDPRLHMFGYTTEHLTILMSPMAEDGVESLGSMGNDAALACLSSQPRLLFDYFKQMFAQVTNPPIDPIREGVVMSLECPIGPEGNLLAVPFEQESARRFRLPQPVLTLSQFEALKNINIRGWRSHVIDITFPKSKGPRGLKETIDAICADAFKVVNDDKVPLLILSDRAASRSRVSIGSLLAVGAVHQHLIRNRLRTRTSIIIETGDAREVHHHCLLLGFGTDAICPYLVYEALCRFKGSLLRGEMGASSVATEESTLIADYKIIANYRKSVHKGILKVMAKMGISALSSYKGAQIFEAVGISSSVISRCFTKTVSRIEGVDYDMLAREMICFHDIAYPNSASARDVEANQANDANTMGLLRAPGEYHWREGGEKHTHEPLSVAALQDAVRANSVAGFARYSQIADANTRECMVRGLFSFKKGASPSSNAEEVTLPNPTAVSSSSPSSVPSTSAPSASTTITTSTPALVGPSLSTVTPPRTAAFTSLPTQVARPTSTVAGSRDVTQVVVPIEEVEPAKEIVKRFCTGAMSYGSISIETHEAIAVAMNRIGGKSNTGEGGENPERYLDGADRSIDSDHDGVPVDSKRSAIKQIASARFGVTIGYCVHADELQIKIAQGAKPGEGGELPGYKVDENIALTRHATPGVGLISPPPHHDIYSIEDLAQLIYDLKNVNPKARIRSINIYLCIYL